MAATPPPSGNQVPIRLNYTASGILFAKANEANRAIAQTQSGAGTLTDVINPVTFATGKINTTNGSTAVTGVDTKFTDDFEAGQFLFYYNYEGDPVLVGRIASIASDTSLTLSSNAPSNQSLVNCGMINRVLGTSENFLIRIPVPINTGTNTAILPNWNGYKNLVTGFNNSNTNNLKQYSVVNLPQTAATPPLTNIDYTITALYNFQKFQTLSGGQQVTRLFQTVNDFPQFCFAEFDPNGENLPANTLYKLFASESFDLNGINVTLSYNPSFLIQAGY
jgi:hypothetical protein